ncbi:MAG: hypothetical protein AB1546_04345 [bacterium]
MEHTGLTADEFEDLLCDNCRNTPLTYYCPMCDFRVCLDCIEKCFKKMRNGALRCVRCGSIDRRLSTMVGPGRYL